MHWFACTVAGLPRLALGRQRRPGAARQGGHGLRDQPAARAPTPCSRPSGCRMPSGSLPATSAPATCCPSGPTTPTSSPASRPPARRTSTRWPSSSSASAARACCPRRAARPPRSAGTTASTARPPRSPTKATDAVLDVRLLRADGRCAAGGVRRLRQRVEPVRRPRRHASTTAAGRTPRPTWTTPSRRRSASRSSTSSRSTSSPPSRRRPEDDERPGRAAVRPRSSTARTTPSPTDRAPGPRTNHPAYPGGSCVRRGRAARAQAASRALPRPRRT